jgi:hypothetical protein
MRKSLLILVAMAACFILLIFFTISSDTNLSGQDEEGNLFSDFPSKYLL